MAIVWPPPFMTAAFQAIALMRGPMASVTDGAWASQPKSSNLLHGQLKKCPAEKVSVLRKVDSIK